MTHFDHYWALFFQVLNFVCKPFFGCAPLFFKEGLRFLRRCCEGGDNIAGLKRVDVKIEGLFECLGLILFKNEFEVVYKGCHYSIEKTRNASTHDYWVFVFF